MRNTTLIYISRGKEKLHDPATGTEGMWQTSKKSVNGIVEESQALAGFSTAVLNPQVGHDQLGRVARRDPIVTGCSRPGERGDAASALATLTKRLSIQVSTRLSPL